MSKPLTDAAARANLDRLADLATGMASYGSQLGRDGLTPVQRIIAAQGTLKSAQGESGGRSSGELWCFTHECKPDSPGGCGCAGERIAWHDPTGDAAIAGTDAATADLSLIKENLLQAEHCLEQVLLVLGRWPGPRDPTLFDMDATEGCFAHRRGGAFAEAKCRREVQPGQVYRLCQWCGNWYDDHKVLPSEAVIEAHGKPGYLKVRDDGAVLHGGHVIDRVPPKATAGIR